MSAAYAPAVQAAPPTAFLPNPFHLEHVLATLARLVGPELVE